MIWQLHTGGENVPLLLAADARVRVYCALVGPSRLHEERRFGGAVWLNVFVGIENWSDVSPGVSVPAVLCLH